MNCVVVRRGEKQFVYDVREFWAQCTAQQILRTDEIFDWSRGRFLRADQFSDVALHLPAFTIQEIIENLVGAALTVGVVLLATAGVATLVEGVIRPPTPRRRRRCRPNSERLETWKKQLVRQRDREICDYCGEYDPNGHVDHKTSRVNGGSNLLRNLVWACSSCNCSKGKMNAPNFRRLLWVN